MSQIDFKNFDPFAGMPVKVRAVSGIIKTGEVVFDENYPNQENARYIYVGTTGNLSYVKWDGTTESIPNIAAGVWHPMCSLKINSSGTTIAADQLRWGS